MSEIDAGDEETFACDDLEYYVNDLGMTPSEAPDSAQTDSYTQGRRDALEWAAGLTEAAGCACYVLWSGGFQFDGSPKEHRVGETFRVTAHDSRCPVARAAKIREGIA